MFTYDAMGRTASEVAHGISTNSFTYNPRGNVATLVDANGKVTTWTYDKDGRLNQKKDAANATYTYTYFPNGWLSNRVDSLNRATRYYYDEVGNLKTNSYVTAGISILYGYDNARRLTSMTDSIGTTTFTYTYSGADTRLLTETPPTAWASSALTHAYANTTMLEDNFSLIQPGAAAWQQSFTYTAGRPLAVTTPAGTFTYTYLGASPVVKQIAATGFHTITNSHDSVGRLVETRLRNNAGTTLNLHQYGYNAAGQRTTLTNLNANYWNFSYDTVGQLTNAVGFESGGATRLHERFGYKYDAAGNLTQRNANGATQPFTVNNLNQVSAGAPSGTWTISGAVTATATPTVTVNGSSGTATVYADKTFARTNSFVTGQNTVSVTASSGAVAGDLAVVTLTGAATYTYDANGNLLGDGRRTFTYDQENQLTSVQVAGAWRTEFYYDGLLRRRIKREFLWNGSGFGLVGEVRYLYDGMQVVQERDGGNVVLATYTRGVDLSGQRGSALNGAGGIGGLLARTDRDGSAYYHADGGGNVTALVTKAGTVAARYWYDPYGNLLAKTGPLADANTYRFSSKEIHPNSGLYYYGYRFYEPNLQRWLNRDPIGERGGINLYGFVGNNPISWIDPYGLEVGVGESLIPVWGSGKQACEDFGAGRWGWGTFNAALAVSDVVPVKAAGTALAKGAWKCGSHTWGATSKWLTKCGWREFKGQEMHHWAVPREMFEGTWSEAIFNQPWNLMRTPNPIFHDALHGVGEAPFNFGQRLWYGTPTWFKAGAFSLGGREVGWLGNNGGSSLSPVVPLPGGGGGSLSPGVPAPFSP